MSISKRLALYDELDRRLSEVLPDQYTIPDIDGIPHGCRELGAATDRMKQLWTVWARLEEEKGGFFFLASLQIKTGSGRTF
jgi:hypothetical protein